MTTLRQLPDSSSQPKYYTESRRSGPRERLSISFTDCKALWIRYHFSGHRTGRFKAGVAAGCFISVRRPFFAALWTLYIHEVMISIFLSTSSVSGRIASGNIITASPRKATVWKCLMLFATV
jgi:hypothetical protein